VATENGNSYVANNTRSQLILIALGVVGNLLLGAITAYTSRLQQDLVEIEAIARTGATNSALLARDVEHLARWTTEEIRELKDRLRRIGAKE